VVAVLLTTPSAVLTAPRAALPALDTVCPGDGVEGPPHEDVHPVGDGDPPGDGPGVD
jgi:hypothetical protein